MKSPARPRAAVKAGSVVVDLSAVIVSVSGDELKVLSVSGRGVPDALPSGPLEARHCTLAGGRRSWAEA